MALANFFLLVVIFLELLLQFGDPVVSIRVFAHQLLDSLVGSADDLLVITFV